MHAEYRIAAGLLAELGWVARQLHDVAPGDVAPPGIRAAHTVLFNALDDPEAVPEISQRLDGSGVDLDEVLRLLSLDRWDAGTLASIRGAVARAMASLDGMPHEQTGHGGESPEIAKYAAELTRSLDALGASGERRERGVEDGTLEVVLRIDGSDQVGIDVDRLWEATEALLEPPESLVGIEHRSSGCLVFLLTGPREATLLAHVLNATVGIDYGEGSTYRWDHDGSGAGPVKTLAPRG